MPIFSIITGFFTKNNTLIYTILVGAIGLFLFYKVYSFYNYHMELITTNETLNKELKLTREKLDDTIKISNENASILASERITFENTIQELNSLHEIEIKNKQRYTSIKEKIKYEKDSDFIAPVLINTIDRLYPKK